MFGVRYRYLFVLLLAVYSFFNIKFTEGDRLFDYELSDTLLIFVLSALVLLIWESNRLIQILLERATNRLPKRIHPLLIQFISSVVVVLLLASLATYSLIGFLGYATSTFALNFKLALGFSFRVNLFLNSINAIVFYMNKSRKSQLEAERFKKQSVEARFEALRNQINPHFLFNCFNVLSTLVYKDADTSARFIEQLSNVYRYLLYNQDQKVVTLKNELEFIDSYIYLLKIRFRENLMITKEIPEGKKDKFVAPATLQMLIENAIKHNVVSKQNPLHIHIFDENGYLVVENNIQPKAVKEPSTHIGLNNIRSRYNFLGNSNPVILHSNGKFAVKIPLIEMDKA